MSSSPYIVFAGGGTGGHLFPALAVVQWMRQHHPEVECAFFCTQRPVDSRILEQWDIPFTVQPIQPFTKQLTALPGFYRSWLRSTRICEREFRRRRPEVVVGTGGYGSGPPVRVAARVGIPSAILNPDAIPGKANRFLAHRVSEIYVQWPGSVRHFKKPAAVHVTGCPVRRAFLEPATGDEYDQLGMDRNLKTLLITGASSGARSINEAVIPIVPELAQVDGWQIFHISGQGDVDRLKNYYSQAGVLAEVVAFTDLMPEILKCSDLAVARAGAVTLAELSATGTPAILMPYPYHKDQHQKCNALQLVERGAAMLLDDSKDASINAIALRKALLPLMRSNDRLAEMCSAAGSRGTADAAELVADRLLDLAKQSAR